MNQHYTYLLVLVLSLAGPLGLSFDKKVGFYKKWKYVFPAMIFPALFFIIWDIVFTKNGVWSFNEDYITGLKLSVLPIEEVLFFFIVPYCCVFIYECVKSYFPSIQTTTLSGQIWATIGLSLLITSVLYHNRPYTFYTFAFTGFLLIAIAMLKRIFLHINVSLILVSYLFILLPFLAVNGILTYIPIVIYNNADNMGIRIFSIPIEDIFYGMLLFLMNILIYEQLLTHRSKEYKTH